MESRGQIGGLREAYEDQERDGGNESHFAEDHSREELGDRPETTSHTALLCAPSVRSISRELCGLEDGINAFLFDCFLV